MMGSGRRDRREGRDRRDGGERDRRRRKACMGGHQVRLIDAFHLSCKSASSSSHYHHQHHHFYQPTHILVPLAHPSKALKPCGKPHIIIAIHHPLGGQGVKEVGEGVTGEITQ